MSRNSNMDNRKQDLLTIIREYESAVETLTAQVDSYAHEQQHLKKEISGLIEENKTLSKTLREIIETKSSLQNTDKQNIENNLVDNLKTQLSLTLQEKDTVVQLWQNSLKNIDQLEDELRVFSGKTHGFFSKEQVRQIKNKYANQIKNLEEQLQNLHAKIQTVLKTSSKTLEDKNFDLEKAFHCQKSAIAQMRALENEVKDLQDKIKDIIKIRDKLEITLKSKNKIIEELKEQMTQSKEKVAEAVQIVEAAFREKDAALLRENKAKEEIVRISKTLSEVLDETSDKIKNDIHGIKQECDEKIKEAHIHADALKEELSNKNIALQKSTYEYKLLQNEFENVKKGTMCLDGSYTSKMLIFDKNLETTFQKLLSSERNVVKIEAEKERVRVEMQQLTTSYQSDIKKYQAESKALKEDLESIKKKLKKCQKHLAQATEEASKLKIIIHRIESKDKYVETKLQSYLDKEINLNKSWKRGMRDVVHKYETQISNLKKANKLLKHKLKRMFKEVLLRSHTKSETCAETDGKIKTKRTVKENKQINLSDN